MSKDDPFQQQFEAAIQELGAVESPFGVAVSGGGDSIALLCLLHRSGRKIRAVTVDHGLRKESAAEAKGVARYCAELGISHDILNWEWSSSTGNLQAAARDARRSLISEWASDNGIRSVFLGHTLDDQAETFLMRLARGSGVDGLSGMAPRTTGDTVIWLRPLLEFRREMLREWLVSEGINWVDDPGNEDMRFDRVKARHALAVLNDLGLGAERLATTSQHMKRTRDALEIATLNLARDVAEPTPLGEVSLELAPLLEAPEELRLRVFSWSLQWVSGAVYRPRFASLEGLLEGKTDRSLHGCLIRFDKTKVVLRREPARVGRSVTAGEVWDGRWLTSSLPGTIVDALGENGLAQCPDWRASGHNREALLTTAAYWRGDELLANPFVKPVASCDAVLKRDQKDYFNFIVRR